MERLVGSEMCIRDRDRSYVWVMSREKKMDEKLLVEILTRLKERGYDMEKIERMKFST